MSVIPVGNRKLMKRQEVRGVFSTDLRPLLKLALAPMPSQPPKQTQTEEIPVGQAQSAQQVEQQDQSQQSQQLDQSAEQGQEGVGGKFTQPGAMDQQQADPNSQAQEVEHAKAEYKRILDLEKQLLTKLKEKNLSAGIKMDTSPKQLRISFNTSNYIVDQADGQPKRAEEALSDIIDWWKVELGGTCSIDGISSAQHREIDKPDAKKRVNFVFSYSPSAQKQEKEDEITTMNGGAAGGANGAPRPNSRMGNVPQKQEVMARTLPELMALRKEALVKQLSQYLATAATSGERK